MLTRQAPGDGGVADRLDHEPGGVCSRWSRVPGPDRCPGRRLATVRRADLLETGRPGRQGHRLPVAGIRSTAEAAALRAAADPAPTGPGGAEAARSTSFHIAMRRGDRRLPTAGQSTPLR